MGHTQSSCIGRPDDPAAAKGAAASPEDRVHRPVDAEARSSARKTIASVDAALAASHGDLLLVVGDENHEEENDEGDGDEPNAKRGDMDVVGVQPTVSTPAGDNPPTSDHDAAKPPLNATSTFQKTDNGKARSFRGGSAATSSGSSRRHAQNSDAAPSAASNATKIPSAHSHVSFWSRLVGRRQQARNGGAARHSSAASSAGTAPSRGPIGQRIHNRFRGVRGGSDDSSPSTMLSLQDSMAASAPPPSAVGTGRRTRRHRIGAGAFWRRRGGMGVDVAGGRAAAGVGVGPDGRLRISSFARDQFFSPHAPGDFGGVVEAGFELMGDKAARTKLIVRDCTENDRCYSAGSSFGRQIFAVRYRAEPEPDLPDSNSQDTSESPIQSDDADTTSLQDALAENPKPRSDIEDTDPPCGGQRTAQQPNPTTSSSASLDSVTSPPKRKRELPISKPPKEDNTSASTGGESRVGKSGDSRPDNATGSAGPKDPPPVDEELRRPRPSRRPGAKSKQPQQVLHGEADFVDYAMGDMGTPQARLMMNKLPPSMTGADSRGRSVHHTSSSMRLRHAAGARAMSSGARLGGGNAIGSGTTAGAIIGPSLDRGLVDVPKGCASYLFTPEAIRTSKVKPVDDFICVDPQCEIYICDIGLTSAQCNKIIEVTERCSRGNYAAYTYAKQTLGCRDYDELALICEWPVMRACATIKARLNGEEAKPESAPTAEGDASKKESREKMELILDDREPHMVKYDVTRKERQKLDMHTDKSEWTFLIALSEGCGVDYDGGGTYFEAIDSIVHLQKGHALIFPGRLRHRGQKITRGLRFLLVGFLIDRNAVDKDWTKPIPQIRK